MILLVLRERRPGGIIIVLHFPLLRGTFGYRSRRGPANKTAPS